MTARTLPQRHCRDLTDHPAHNWRPGVSSRWTKHIFTHHCPGRYTPSNYREPDASPAQPKDPFAGIAAAYGEEE